MTKKTTTDFMYSSRPRQGKATRRMTQAAASLTAVAAAVGRSGRKIRQEVAAPSRAPSTIRQRRRGRRRMRAVASRRMKSIHRFSASSTSM